VENHQCYQHGMVGSEFCTSFSRESIQSYMGFSFKGNNLAIAKVLQEYIFKSIYKSNFMV